MLEGGLPNSGVILNRFSDESTTPKYRQGYYKYRMVS
jgi:hypothetical protein